MTQKSSDLLAALKKKGVTYITARDMKGAIDYVEWAMGECWKDARGSRHVAHQMLEDYFVSEYGRLDKYGRLVAENYIPRKDEVLTKVIVGYRPMSAQELRERQEQLNVQRLIRRRKRYRGTKRSCARRAARERRTAPPAKPIVPVGTSKVRKEEKFSAFLTPKKIRRFRIGDLSNG